MAPKSEDGLREAAVDWQSAVFEGDADHLWAALPAVCRASLSRDVVESSALRGARTFSELARPQPLSDVEIVAVEVRNFSGEQGDVRVLTDNAGVNEVSAFVTWSYENGRWRHPCTL